MGLTIMQGCLAVYIPSYKGLPVYVSLTKLSACLVKLHFDLTLL